MQRNGGSSVRDTNRAWVLGVAVIVVAAAVVPLFVLPAGFKPSENIAYVSILVTAVVTIIGYVSSRQAAQRLSDERERDEKHLRKEKEADNRRLQLDAAMRAGALFAPTANQRPTPAAAASGLLALAGLGQADLAVVLLVDLWSGDQELVSTETAILVIDSALRTPGDPRAQLIAAELLCRNAARLDTCQSLHWPSAVDGCWNPDFGPKTKLLIVDALTRMALTSPHNENALRSVAVRLYGIWSGDADLRVKGCVGTLINALIPSLRELGYTDFLQGNQKVMLRDLEAAGRSATANPDGFLDQLAISRSQQLRTWAADCGATDHGPGALATAAPVSPAGSGPILTITP
jgi:hypothetical protein